MKSGAEERKQACLQPAASAWRSAAVLAGLQRMLGAVAFAVCSAAATRRGAPKSGGAADLTQLLPACDLKKVDAREMSMEQFRE